MDNGPKSKLTKMNSKWITDLNTKHKTIKLLQIRQDNNTGKFGYGDDILATKPKTQGMLS